MGEIHVDTWWDEAEARAIASELVGSIETSAGLKGGAGPLTINSNGVVALARATWNAATMRVAERARQGTEDSACVDRVFAPPGIRPRGERGVRRKLDTVVHSVYPPWQRDVRGYALVCLAGGVRVDHGGGPGDLIFSPGYGAARGGEPFVFADGSAARVEFLAPGQAARIPPWAAHAAWLSPDTVAVGVWLLSPGPALDAYRAAFRRGEHPQFRRTPVRRRAPRTEAQRAWERARFPGGVPGAVATKRLERGMSKTLQLKNL